MIQLLYAFSAIKVPNLESDTNVLQECLVSGESVLGIWNYTMINVESSYEKGVLFISKNENTYDVVIKYPVGIYTCQDVIIDNDRVNFNVNIAGLERVSFVLMVEGDLIIGESYSTSGSSQIKGTRQLPVR
ncbi:hypothetical protein [uncultured Maribacter sp.]|uniref:hypothetical protein n=1 Tax=uncultured Maribacter sp. TaxID=431308 RepID=UPI0030DB284E